MVCYTVQVKKMTSAQTRGDIVFKLLLTLNNLDENILVHSVRSQGPVQEVRLPALCSMG